MSAERRVGVIGGTFDPIHLGHLAAARAACDTLGLERVLFVPSHHPPHRRAQPSASPFHRFAMVSLAIGGTEAFLASDYELQREGLSYTADTLRALAATGLAPSQIFFVLGTDAFAEIATWHQYPEVLDLAHFAVISRPGQSFDALRARLPEWTARMRDVGWACRPSDAPRPSDATEILLISAATPDVSATAIRARAAEGLTLAGLVPLEVERHIRRHRLYASPTGRLLA